jgi:hypothetical protein
MIRTNTPRGLVLLAVTLALFIGVFFLPPTVAANEQGQKPDEDWCIGKDPAVGSGGDKGDDEGQGDGGDADPDWFQGNTANMQKRVPSLRDEAPRRTVLPVVGPYGQLVKWLLDQFINRYFGIWR